jgi:hypothetical protein
MSTQAIFSGLVFDEIDQPVDVRKIGDETFYVVNDAGFFRHISSEVVDRQVLNFIREQMKGKENLISEQAAMMLGQEDIFSQAIIQKQLEQIDQQFETLLNTGIPESGRAYMGMLGFKITINIHGDVINIEQPSTAGNEDGEQ